MNLESFNALPPYALHAEEKSALLLPALLDLTRHHATHCAAYQRILQKMAVDVEGIRHLCDLPFISIRLFKAFELKSICDEEVFKTLTSSGTSGQAVSKIYLDKATAANQQKTLVKIVSSFTQNNRMPMLIIDSPSVIKNRNMFSARGAAILGFSIFGADRTYALDDDMNLNVEVIQNFLKKHQGRKILLFGFTFIVWQYFYQQLKAQNIKIDLSNAVLIHGGGWKKLVGEAVSKEEFKKALNDVSGIQSVHDYYGTVEQTGCIYMECEHGFLHCSNYSDIFIRKPQDFSLVPHQTKGIIQLISALPHSYPGHSLLTEDEGVILGEDNCPCGRCGKYFQIFGRIKNAELRGCSDTYEKP